MPVFEKRSPMPVGSAALFAYHARPGALDRLIPPWQATRIVQRADNIRDGARIVMEMKLAPLVWKCWVAEHFDYLEGVRFRDRQLSGPFKAWTHSHLISGDAATSELEDHVEYEVPAGAIGRALMGGKIAGDLERMFRFRHARTLTDLTRQAPFADRPRMTIAVSGATGSIASNLTPFLTTAGHRVMRLSRGAASDTNAIRWNATTGEVDRQRLAGCDAIVHLAGKNIATRWTATSQREMWQSRVDATRKLCETLAAMPTRPRTLVAASAVGFYGDRGDELLDESSSPGDAWVSKMCTEWEAATQPARDVGMRVVNLRISVVISAYSGALPKMLKPTRLGLAGRVGSGNQFVPWIAMDDLVYVIHKSLMLDAWSGPINAVTGSTTQADFIHTLGHVLHRPTIAPMPALVVRTLFGAMGKELLLASANVQPTRLRQSGFVPSFSTLESALRFELGR